MELSHEEIHRRYMEMKKEPVPPPRIKWKRGHEGFKDSVDGRFSIQPLYLGTSTPQFYQLDDRKTGKAITADNQRNLKSHAEDVLRKEEK